MSHLAINNNYLTQGSWFISPQTGSDGYDGTSSTFTSGNTGPLKTYRELARRWGTYSPILNQDTTITFVTGHTDNSDPVIFNPYVGKASFVLLTGTPSAPVSGTLGTITAKNRNSNVLLSVSSVPGGGAVGQYIVNSSRSNSRCLIYKSLGGGAFTLTQPFIAITLPRNLVPAEDDTWASSDNVTVSTLPTVNLVSFKPQVLDGNLVSGTKGISVAKSYVQGIIVYDPFPGTNTNATGESVLATNTWARFFDVVFQRRVNVEGGIFSVSAGTNNCGIANGITVASNQGANFSYLMIGGWVSGTIYGSSLEFDGDIISTALMAINGVAGIGAMAMDGTASLIGLIGGKIQVVAINYSTAQIYGTGHITISSANVFLQILSPGHVQYPSGAGAAAATFTNPGIITLDRQTTAYSINGTTLNAGITISPANLDAAAGAAGFGGIAFVFSGSSISNI